MVRPIQRDPHQGRSDESCITDAVRHAGHDVEHGDWPCGADGRPEFGYVVEVLAMLGWPASNHNVEAVREILVEIARSWADDWPGAPTRSGRVTRAMA